MSKTATTEQPATPPAKSPDEIVREAVAKIAEIGEQLRQRFLGAQ